MARPTTKIDLIESANASFEKLWGLIDSMPMEMQIKEFNFDEATLGKEAHWKRDKNIRDVLIHLYEWHNLLLNWENSNQNGELKPFLPSPYNWKTYGKMNIEFLNRHQDTEYEKSKDMIKNSHKKVMDLVEKYTNEELFSKGKFSWTGTTTFGSYCVSATASHYNWAIKKIRKHIKTQK